MSICTDLRSRAHRSRAMTYMDLVGSAGGPSEVGARISSWVVREPEKVAARAFGVSPRTIKSWRAGQLPQMRHLMAMARRWGVAFLNDVFAPVLAGDITMATRLERLEAEIAAIRREVICPAEPTLEFGADTGLDTGETNAGIRINGHWLPEPKRREWYRDDAHNQVEVVWLGLEALRHESSEMLAFAQSMRSVAGAPPAPATLSPDALPLSTVHLVDVTANSPDDFSFRHLGWIGLDAPGLTRLAEIPAEALKSNAQQSYLDAKVFGEPSYCHVTRKLGSGERLSYTRLIWPALSNRRDQLLWVGIRREH